MILTIKPGIEYKLKIQNPSNPLLIQSFKSVVGDLSERYIKIYATFLSATNDGKIETYSSVTIIEIDFLPCKVYIKLNEKDFILEKLTNISILINETKENDNDLFELTYSLD